MKSKTIHRKHPARRRPLGQALSPRLLRASPAPREGSEPSPAGPPSSGRRPAGRAHRGPGARGPSPRSPRSRHSVPSAEQKRSQPHAQPPPADTWTPGAPSPAKTSEDVRVPAGNQAPRPRHLPTGTQPSQGERGKRSASLPQSLSQLGSASRGGSSWRPRSQNGTTPPRAQRPLRDPVSGAGVLVPIR